MYPSRKTGNEEKRYVNAIGFTAEPRRLNVAITRAKSQLIIVGNIQLLQMNSLWKQVIEYVRVHGQIIESKDL